MNTLEEQRKLSDSLLKACKAAGIEEPKYIAQDEDGEVWAFKFKPIISYVWNLWGDSNHEMLIDHPPYATDWRDSLLEWVEPQVENFNITKAAAMAKWRDSFAFTETEKQQIEDYAVAENEPLANVLARHPDYFHFAMETECNDDGEPIAIYARNHHGDITEMIRPDHIADTSKMIPSGIEALVCADIAKRQQVGIAKYGTTLADNPLTLLQGLQHAYEESLDFPIYLKKIITDLQAMAEKGGEKL